jgi:ERF superfamily
MIDAPPAPGAKPAVVNAPVPVPPPAGTAPVPAPAPAPAGMVVSPPSGAEILARAAEEKRQQQAEVAELVLQETRRSPRLGKLALALAKAQAEMGGAARDSENPFFKSKYASLAACWDAWRLVGPKQGLALIQLVAARGRLVIITTLLVLGAEDGEDEWIEERLVLSAQSDTPQAVGSAATTGRRYALSGMVGLSPVDDDGEAASRTIAPGTKWDKGARTGSHQPISGNSDELPEGPEAPGMPSAGEPAISPSEGNRPVPPVVTAPVVRAGTPAPSGAPPPPGRPPARAPGAPTGSK